MTIMLAMKDKKIQEKGKDLRGYSVSNITVENGRGGGGGAVNMVRKFSTEKEKEKKQKNSNKNSHDSHMQL